MTWTRKTSVETTRTAAVSNTQLRGTFYLDATPALRFQLHIDNDTDADGEISDIDLTALTPAEQNTLKQLLVKLRDGALAARGYANL